MGRFSSQFRDFDTGARHYPGADELRLLANIPDLEHSRNDSEFLQTVQHTNTVCFRGAQYTDGIFSHRCQGHWGDAVYPGVLAVRDGVMVHVDKNKAPKRGDRIPPGH